MSFETALHLNQRIKAIQDRINTSTHEGLQRFEEWQAISDTLAQYLTI